MRKSLLAFATLLTMVACVNKTTTNVENEEIDEVPFEVAKNYFYKHNVGVPSSKITTEEEFKKHFGMATLMGEEGKPTEIDFSKQFVVDFILPASKWEMEINPLKVETKGDTLFYSYDINVGKKQSYFTQPVSIIIIDKEFEKQEVVLVNNQDITYEQAIKRYLVNEIGKDYAQGEYCVPFYSQVDIDDSNPEDIKNWGNFWVNNYNIEGDTLKCVSGGNYPGVFHMTKDYKVTSFDVVEDGGNFESSAKELFGDRYEDFMKIYSDSDKINEDRKITVSDYRNLNGLTEVTKMQDEGWDPVDLYIN